MKKSAKTPWNRDMRQLLLFPLCFAAKLGFWDLMLLIARSNIRMPDTRVAQGNENPKGSSNNEDNQECMLNMKEIFDHLFATLKKEHPVAPPAASPTRAPIGKLAQHRAYTFTCTVETNLEVAEYWSEATWETTILIAPTESVTWKFFLKEFKKKCVTEQDRDEGRKRFLYLKQGNRPVEQYVVDLYKYCKYGSEYIQTEVGKCKKFIDALNDDLSPLFTALDIMEFQNLVNRAIATKAKMKAAEKRGSSSHRNDKRPRTESKPQWQFKKPKSYWENSSASVSMQKSKHLSRPQSVSRPPALKISVNSTKNSGKAPICNYCQRSHPGQCRAQTNLCYMCGEFGHYIRDCPQNPNKLPSRVLGSISTTSYG
ncbi:hypothetical protein V6N12_045834 [Hibiscus sabdariffa]|uniref:CCHC-type domain-containing protein n=1 Tax=Hibiscus sabdariffa TaxID=183260 RepID=A0ABR2G3Y0_9ROSI